MLGSKVGLLVIVLSVGLCIIILKNVNATLKWRINDGSL